jgi:hypothetical protein
MYGLSSFVQMNEFSQTKALREGRSSLPGVLMGCDDDGRSNKSPFGAENSKGLDLNPWDKWGDTHTN